jgi:hypothetical protein
MRLTARETVAMETPARLATSRMLTVPGRPVALFLGVFTSGSILRFPDVSQPHFGQKISAEAVVNAGDCVMLSPKAEKCRWSSIVQNGPLLESVSRESSAEPGAKQAA